MGINVQFSTPLNIKYMEKNNKQLEANGLSIAGMILGILSIVFCWFPFLNILLALLATIFGAVTRKRKYGKAGLIMGSITLSLLILTLFALFALAVFV